MPGIESILQNVSLANNQLECLIYEPVNLIAINVWGAEIRVNRISFYPARPVHMAYARLTQVWF
jgi:hypothetical protein